VPLLNQAPDPLPYDPRHHLGDLPASFRFHAILELPLLKREIFRLLMLLPVCAPLVNALRGGSEDYPNHPSLRHCHRGLVAVVVNSGIELVLQGHQLRVVPSPDRVHSPPRHCRTGLLPRHTKETELHLLHALLPAVPGALIDVRRVPLEARAHVPDVPSGAESYSVVLKGGHHVPHHLSRY